MEYNMGLQEKYFDYMKNGSKKIEIRLNDDKRKLLNVGDTIYFMKEPDRIEKFKSQIVSLTHYNDFTDALNNINIEDVSSIDTKREEYLNDLEMFYSKEEQQKYGVLAIEIEKVEKSCGMAVFKEENNEIYILIAQHIKGHWDLPKGHVEEGETEIETALRETLEETGIKAKQIGDFRKIITYSPYYNTVKDVVFFIGKALNDEIIPQVSEIKTAEWVNVNEIYKIEVPDNAKELLNDAISYYKELKNNNE